ncbi:glucose-6-phosphate isomerase [Chelatococcus sp. SYSU_G07232]|uniref:Glucose-6-phosphate isomerase n=1 Tax=Chelatococcus albus TaxID=3047466 RepID=A0ABT7AES9_9HYPH|nr:glucose-6-phosphate isomerase [Chelatococcus sp. SYSU_G07232]MDJ1157878.1 glucose-6-phosphate isomerase [Chelatococcus sp. SYSU_G07232]
MGFTQSIDLALASKIGGDGLSDTALDAALVAVERALGRLREERRAGRLPLLAMPTATDDLPAVTAAAERLCKGATDVIFLGTGGSSLGGQALAQLRDYAVPALGRFAEGPRVHFLDNLDPLTFEGLLQRLPLATSRFAAISKSGGTGETLMQAIAVLGALDRAGLRAMAGEFFLGLSEPQKEGARRNALRALLEPEGAPFLDHHTGIGGRYSVLTNVGLLPAAVLGLDIAAIRRGASQSLQGVPSGSPAREIPAAVGAALNVAAALEGKAISVFMGYADRLERFTRWWVQLWAESLGKGGKGTQPVGALGPVDQHSQQQLYLAGPKDKLFTVVTTGVAGKGPSMDAELAARAGEPGFAAKTIGDLVAAQGLAMIDTFAKNGCPVRHIHVPRLDEKSLGGLLMHFMLETILTGYALGVDPFDQPAVEEAKILAKKYLAEGRG